ncbi:MAG TPA: hypothetical protein PKH58_01405 [Paludibacteraceae bacterium]|nr:hypothetical protein [Paludibacteraceae bacterium]
MIEIIVNNTTRLQLPSKVKINIVQKNPLFLEDRIPSPYSLSFEVPVTAGNLAAMGQPARITSSSIKARQPGKIMHNGMVIGAGEILLLEVNKVLKLQFKGSPLNGNFNKNLNQITNDEYDYGTMTYHGEDINYSDTSFDAYVQNLRSEANNASHFVLAPVKLADTEWNGTSSYLGAKNGLINYLNFWNVATASWFTGDVHYMHMPVVPFPYLKDTIAKAFGSNLESNPFASGDLAKLVTISANHPHLNLNSLYDWYLTGPNLETKQEVFWPLLDSYVSSNYLIPLKFNIMNFMQAYAFNEFLKEILKMFSMSAFPGIQYRIEKNNDIFDRSVVVNWSDKLAGKPIIKTRDAKDYNFKFRNAGEKASDPVRTKPNIDAIYDSALEQGSEEVEYSDAVSGAIIGITKELFGDASEPRLTQDTKQSALSATIEDTGLDKYEVNCEVEPLPMSIEQYWSDNENPGNVISHKHWHVPVIEKPGLNDAPNIMIWGGMANTFEGDGTYPLLMNHHTDHFGTKRGSLSLLPDGPDGLISTFHSGMKSWIECEKKSVKGSFRLSPLEIRNIDMRDKIYLHGRLFYIEKIEYSLTHNDVSLVEADLIEC